MDSYGEILRLCRLCLVKDQVSIPIFDDPGDLRQIFFKISSCLPVKISQEDRLPKKICDGCLNKLDIVYEFWNSTANAEKTLLSRLAALDEEKAEEPPVPKPIQETVVKEELELVEETKPDVALEESHHDETECPPSKRARTQINTELEEDDLDTAEVITKVEEEIDNEEVSFADMPSTSADDAQPGPSGLGKDGEEAPLNEADLKQNILSVGNNYCCGNMDESHLRTNKMIGQSRNVYYRCVTCKSNFYDPQELRRHMHQDNCQYICERSGRQLDSKLAMVMHVIDHNIKEEAELTYGCDKCTMEFDNEEEFDNHQLGCLENLGIERNSVKKAVESTEGSTVVDYANISSNDSELIVIKSSDQIADEMGKTMHSILHTGENRHTCKFCQKSFKQKHLLDNHLRVHIDKKPYCDTCKKYFSHKWSLDTHLRIHTGEKPFTCDICEKCFTQKVNLIAHLRLHTGEKPYNCQICKKSFRYKQSLNFHLQIHTGEKSMFSCKFCEKYFTKKIDLTKHLTRIHHGEKPYNCQFCDNSFTRKGDLSKHLMRIHSGKKLYNCHICEKSFAIKYDLDKHLKTISHRTGTWVAKNSSNAATVENVLAQRGT